MIKVIEKTVEPEKVITGSTFLLKIKCFKGQNYNELKEKTYTEANEYEYGQFVKGE